MISYCFEISNENKKRIDIVVFILLNCGIIAISYPNILGLVDRLKSKKHTGIIKVHAAFEDDRASVMAHEERKSNFSISDLPMFNTPDLSFTTQKELDYMQNLDFSFCRKNPCVSRNSLIEE